MFLAEEQVVASLSAVPMGQSVGAKTLGATLSPPRVPVK